MSASEITILVTGVVAGDTRNAAGYEGDGSLRALSYDKRNLAVPRKEQSAQTRVGVSTSVGLARRGSV
jgi:hypothetical protein